MNADNEKRWHIEEVYLDVFGEKKTGYSVMRKCGIFTEYASLYLHSREEAEAILEKIKAVSA